MFYAPHSLCLFPVSFFHCHKFFHHPPTSLLFIHPHFFLLVPNGFCFTPLLFSYFCVLPIVLFLIISTKVIHFFVGVVFIVGPFSFEIKLSPYCSRDSLCPPLSSKALCLLLPSDPLSFSVPLLWSATDFPIPTSPELSRCLTSYGKGGSRLFSILVSRSAALCPFSSDAPTF